MFFATLIDKARYYLRFFLDLISIVYLAIIEIVITELLANNEMNPDWLCPPD